MPVKFIMIAFQSGISVNPTANTNQEFKKAITLQLTDFDVERVFVSLNFIFPTYFPIFKLCCDTIYFVIFSTTNYFHNFVDSSISDSI